MVRLAALAVCGFLVGCSSPILSSTPEADLLASGKYAIIQNISVPRIDGPDGCGAQALATVLAFGEPEADVDALAAELPWHDHGATPVDLLLTARSRGAHAQIERGTWQRLSELVAAHRPVIVMLDVGIEVQTLVARHQPTKIMHWSVVSGMGHDDDAILLAAPNQHHHAVDEKEFMRRWAASDYCLIITAPADDRSERIR